MGQYYLGVCVVGCAAAMAALGLQYKHLLGVLLALEGVLINLSILLFCACCQPVLCHSVLVFIALSASEAALGLAVLVCLVRSHGNDYVSSLTGLGC